MRTRAATGIAAILTLTAIVLVVDRGGVLAWVGASVGAALLVKIFLRPSASDFVSSIAAVTLWAVAWAGTSYYVVSTWESGEVVELGIATPGGTHAARVWVLDADDSVVLIYDADPDIAEALMSGDPVSLGRNGEVSSKRPLARPIEDVPQREVELIFQLMDRKYGKRNAATDVFYRFLGRPRDRVVMIVTLAE